MSLDLISALAAYIPRDRVEQILHPDFVIPTDGVALIADISGFTPLTEALTQGLQPDQGAEELTKALDAVFTPLIADIHTYRGSVIKFGGDALIAWFGRAKRERKTTVIRRAITAAARMQNAMAVHGQIPTPIGIVTLRMKIGLTYGPVKRFNIGLEKFGYEDVIAGSTMDNMAAAEYHAEPGDIMTDQATAALVPHLFTTTDIRDGFVAIGKIRKPALPISWPRLKVEAGSHTAVTEQLATYVPQQIKERLILGQQQVAELKSVVSLFVQFHGLDFDHDRQVLARLQTYFAKTQEVVSWYGGRLNRLITGDKGNLLHIIFGAPLTVEEQEKRAVRCALDLQNKCGTLPFITMQRIGLTTGRVFAGPVGAPMRSDYTTMGDSINLSARLMQNAADHQILFDEAVYQQLDQSFATTDLGHIKVKGKTKPIHIFTAEKATVQTRRIRPQQLQPIFGRTQELIQMRRMIAQLEQGKGQIAIFVGDVGMGKTLILDTLRAETEQRWKKQAQQTQQTTHGRWLSGISLAYGQTLSGYLFIDLLRDLLELPADATPTQTSTHLLTLCTQLFGADKVDAAYPYLAQFMGLPLEPEWAERLAGLAGESLRWQLFNIIPSLFARLCLNTPVLISLDDLQWSDPTSIQLIQTLIPLTRTNPIFLLLSMRPTTAPRIMALADQLQRFETVPAAMTLDPLTEPEAQLLISYYAPQLPAKIRPSLIEKGGGSPLFLVELLRTLEAQGVLTDGTDLTTLDVEALDLPNSVQGLLLAQIDRLTTEARHTLQMAAVIGKNFLDEVLYQLAQAEQALNKQIIILEENEFIQEINASELGREHTFRHILIQESAYSTLLYQRRRDYHKQVAQALETLFPLQIGEQSGVLAHHYEQAGNLSQAIAFHQQTADQARLLYANEESAALYHKVLALLDQLEETASQSFALQEQRAKTYLKIAQLYANQMDFTAAQTFFNQAFSLFERLNIQQTRKHGRTRKTAQPPLRWGVLPEHLEQFDPALTSAVENSEIIHNLFEGLVELDHNWVVIPAVAHSWAVSADGRTYTFHLKQDGRWSDGHPLTAHDFVFAWRRNLHPDTKAPLAYQLYPILGADGYHQGQTAQADTIAVKATDNWTLEVTLSQPNSFFLYVLSSPITFPQPRHFWDSQPAVSTPMPREQTVGNGAFQLTTTADGLLHLTRNSHYKGWSRGTLETVEIIPTMPDVDAFTAGKIDWCRSDDAADIPHRFPEQSFLVQHLMTFVVGFATHCPPFDQTEVRQAFAAALNKTDLVNNVWNGVQKPAAGGVIPPGMSGHSPEIAIPYDPQQAQAAWQANGHHPPLTLAAIPGFQTTPEYLQQRWQEAFGVEINIQKEVPFMQALEDFKEGKVQMVLLGLGLNYPDPSNVLHAMGHSTGSFNYFQWHQASYDQLLDDAAATADYERQLAHYHQADKLITADEAVLIPLYYLQAHAILRHPFTLQDTDKILRINRLLFKHISASRQ